MAHHHDHSHDHAHTHTANKKVLGVSFAVIALFMLVEAVGGWLTHSLALLSDAGHMFSDAFSLGVALLAFKFGERDTTLSKTFGYKRFEILTAAFNGLTLMVIAALIFYEAVKRLIEPPEIATVGMLVISVIGLLVNIAVAVYMLRNSDTQDNVNMRGAYLHVISDLFGSIGAIVAALLMMAYGWQWADPVASVLVAALVGRSGWHLLKQTLHILMEGAPENIHTDEVLAVIQKAKGVESVHDLHVWTITSNVNVLSCHIVVDGALTVAQAEQLVYQIEHDLSHLNIAHCTIQVESRRHPHENSVLCPIGKESEHEHSHEHEHEEPNKH
ncbi:cation diffusion facilitator family transporter [Neisseria perflava]|uniref:cation diffusion facilitator family transporter n=1 Tax=Neisseria perflava TaxID=33053 RepID=UPI00209CD1D3|nr:cation diffusion facilitator family transporter [Neisseria perflava]MCP1661270.1 cobalt-zinc-cadmium efflux system protein [Neisseria perflava]MCP1772337.1 cobalt-zinc-cadmium efflux system protein [Neisseria perflava]